MAFDVSERLAITTFLITATNERQAGAVVDAIRRRSGWYGPKVARRPRTGGCLDLWTIVPQLESAFVGGTAVEGLSALDLGSLEPPRMTKVICLHV